jgi:dolichol-phosphate mannosyltransferase
VIVLMDADLQDRPEDIPLLLESLQGDVEIVYSVKEMNHETGLIRLTSAIYHRVFSRLTNTHVPTNISTMRLFSRRFLLAMREYPERNIVLGPLMFHMGYPHKIVELPRDKRQGSKSSYSFRKRLALAVNSLLSYTDLPHRFLVWFGAIVFGLSVIYSIVLVVSRVFAWQDAPSGLTLLALLISLSLGATMVGLGIIGMYVFRVYQEVLRRPRYLVARRLNLPVEKM